jgi:hypothetical protein
MVKPRFKEGNIRYFLDGVQSLGENERKLQNKEGRIARQLQSLPQLL